MRSSEKVFATDPLEIGPRTLSSLYEQEKRKITYHIQTDDH
jgi:hypothetical protein